MAASTTPVPLFTLFALKALLDLEAMISNNVKGGTMLAEAGRTKNDGNPKPESVPEPSGTSVATSPAIMTPRSSQPPMSLRSSPKA